jgi:predicted Zn-dependent protease
LSFARTLLAVVAFTGPWLTQAAQEPVDPVLAALEAELSRQAAALGKAPTPTYFLSYQLTDNHSVRAWASLGALVHSGEADQRNLDLDLRVGSPALDNTHPLRDGGFGEGPSAQDRRAIPLDGDGDALRLAIWRETERSYRRAVQLLQRVKASVQVKVAQEDRSGDFSAAPAEVHLDPIAPFAFDKAAWEQRLRKATAPFAEHPEIIDGSATVSAELETRRYVNTDGSRIRISATLYRLNLQAQAKADDGMDLPLHRTWVTYRPDGLPDDAALAREVASMVETLLALRKAPLAEPYAGPAILSGRASAVFFHEIFGHRIEGHRQKGEDEAQTFKNDLGRSILPGFLSVYSDPTLQRIGETDLAGWYRFDDEGVKASRVTIVKDGVLRSFLLSRSPIAGFDRSNGHGRRQQGNRVVARQSNLVIESAKPVSRAELKKQLIAQVKAAGKPYGLLFEEIEGGFTFTQRIIPNAFNVRPTVVFRIRPDGQEELVRGVDLIGTPLTAFSKIVATDDQVETFNGVCGAESGWVPVSAVSPALLVSQIEVQRKEKSPERAPLLPPPPAAREE